MPEQFPGLVHCALCASQPALRRRCSPATAAAAIAFPHARPRRCGLSGKPAQWQERRTRRSPGRWHHAGRARHRCSRRVSNPRLVTSAGSMPGGCHQHAVLLLTELELSGSADDAIWDAGPTPGWKPCIGLRHLDEIAALEQGIIKRKPIRDRGRTRQSQPAATRAWPRRGVQRLELVAL